MQGTLEFDGQYSITSTMRARLGEPLIAQFNMKVSLFQRFYTYVHVNARDVKWGRAMVSCLRR